MSQQLNTFATSSSAVGTLMRAYEKNSLDMKFFWPKLEGVDHNVRGFVRQIQPQSVPAFGQTIIYNIQKSANFCKDMTLELILSAITAAGSTFTAYKNDISGIFVSIELYQGGASIQRRDFDEIMYHNAFMVTYEESVALSEAVGILPFATRAARSGANQTFEIPLRTLLDYFSVPISLLSDEVQVQLTFKPLVNCVQTDGTNPQASILSATIRGEFVQAPPKIMDDILAASKVGSVCFPFVDLATVQAQLPAGTQNARVLLSQFRGPTQVVAAWVREQQQVNDTTGNPAFEWTNTVAYQSHNWQDVSQNIVSNPNDIIPDYIQLHTIPMDFHNYFNSANRNTQYPMLWSFAMEPTLDLHLQEAISTGYYSYDMTQSGYLIVNFPAPVPNAIVITAYGYFLNALLVTNGSVRKWIA